MKDNLKIQARNTPAMRQAVKHVTQIVGQFTTCKHYLTFQRCTTILFRDPWR